MTQSAQTSKSEKSGKVSSRLTAVLYREDKVYVATCPQVGTSSFGDTIDEALANLKEATELYLEDCDEELPALEAEQVFLTTFEAEI